MSKPISSYPQAMRDSVVARRMRQYDPEGANGLGVLSAVEANYKRMGYNNNAVKAMMSKPKHRASRARITSRRSNHGTDKTSQ